MIEKILYGTVKGQPDYMAEVISENESEFDAVMKHYADNGYDRFEVKTINLSIPPNFIKTINLNNR